MDDIERADRHATHAIDCAIANRVRYEGVSATRCDECGEAIPERRRELIAGTQHCAPCRTELDRLGLP